MSTLARMPVQPLWTVAEVAAFLQLSKDFVYKHAARGELPCRKVGGALRFVPDEIRSWLDRQGGGQP